MGTYLGLGRHAECLDHFQLALAKYHEAGEFGTGWALSSLGGVYLELRRLDGALHTEQQALSVWRQLGNQHGEGIALNNLGDIRRELGHLDDASGYLADARAHWHDALAIFDQLGDPRAEEVRTYLTQSPNNVTEIYCE